MRKGRPISQIVTQVSSFPSPRYSATQKRRHKDFRNQVYTFFETKLITMCNGKCCTRITNLLVLHERVRSCSDGSEGAPGQFAFSAPERGSARSKNTLKQVTYICFVSYLLDDYTVVQAFVFHSNRLKAFDTFVTADTFYFCGTSPGLDSHTELQ